MSKSIRISVGGAESPKNSPPAAADVVNQVGDVISLLANLEKATFDDGEQRVNWRITSASGELSHSEGTPDLAETIRITVRDAESQGNEAPLASAALAQLKDIVSLLGSLEMATFADGEQRVIWCIAKVSSTSAVHFEIAPCLSQPTPGFRQRVHKVVRHAARGIRDIGATGRNPPSFNQRITRPLMRMHKRALNGEVECDVDFSAFGKLPKFCTRQGSARRAIEAIAVATEPSRRPHRAIGSLEGLTASIELDAKERQILWIRDRLTGNLVKCVLSEDALKDIGRYRIPRILRGLRVRAHGTVFYRSRGAIDHIETDRLYVYPRDMDIVSFDNAIPPSLSGDVEVVENS